LVSIDLTGMLPIVYILYSELQGCVRLTGIMLPSTKKTLYLAAGRGTSGREAAESIFAIAAMVSDASSGSWDGWLGLAVIIIVQSNESRVERTQDFNQHATGCV
jgi:hypothetical protein